MTVADALNYPYIRVRDVEWLKRALLVFPHVVRMTPGFARGAPADDQMMESNPSPILATMRKCLYSGQRGWIFPCVQV